LEGQRTASYVSHFWLHMRREPSLLCFLTKAYHARQLTKLALNSVSRGLRYNKGSGGCLQNGSASYQSSYVSFNPLPCPSLVIMTQSSDHKGEGGTWVRTAEGMFVCMYDGDDLMDMPDQVLLVEHTRC
jgi:hypothetical protein